MSTTFALLIGFLFPQPAAPADGVVAQALTSIDTIATQRSLDGDVEVQSDGMRYRGIELILLSLEARG